MALAAIRPDDPRWLRVARLGLLAAVALVYHAVLNHAFVNFDDPLYLTENGRVTAGWTADGLQWAWTNKDALQWQPLTWMAHMAVSELAGMRPAVHLGVNVALHAVNALLLFGWLRALTGAPRRSLAVALLFAVHPVNVETVAWASQLKSTLSTALGLLALRWWVAARDRPGMRGVWAAALALAGSLLAKPMLVSFPILLLLLDLWPQSRLPATGGRQAAWRLVGEKLPFLVIAALAVAVTALPWGAKVELNTVQPPELARGAAVAVNYVRYLGLLVWPLDLAVLYPEKIDYPPAWVVAAWLGLAGLTGLVWRERARRPVLLFGWLWFCLTLLPVSGLVRLGPQGIADRYLYFPAIGLFVAIVWTLAEWPWLRSRSGMRWAGLALLGVLALRAVDQVGVWQDSLTLWRQASAVTEPSAAGRLNLGHALFQAGRRAEAAAAFQDALRLEPGNPRAYVNLALLAQARGELGEAERLLRAARVLAPRDARILSNLGSLRQDRGDAGEARALLEQAVVLQPALYEARMNLGVLLAQAGDSAGAMRQFAAALALRPGDVGARHNLELATRAAR